VDPATPLVPLITHDLFIPAAMQPPLSLVNVVSTKVFEAFKEMG